MGNDNVDLDLLINCTLFAVQRFPWATRVNESLVLDMNKTNVFSLLSDMFEAGRERFNDDDPVKQYIHECLFPSPTIKYELPWEQKAAWGVIFGAMLFVAITGNCIVLWIVLAHRRMRTVTNYFLLNLSLADLLMSSLNCVFNFIFMLNSDWPFGSIYCTINNFIANVSVASSVFTLVAISFDRYIAIVKPLRHRTSRKKARIFLMIIWVLSCILAAPCLLYSATMTRRYLNGKSRTVCYMLWPDGRYPTSMADYIYNVVFLVLTYGIPMLVMIVCYSLMGRELWGSRSIGEHTERQLESMKSKKKVVRMFIIIVSIFAICWLPYHLFFIYAYHNPEVSSRDHVQHIYLAFYWLAMSNAMVNPIIYYWMNGRFRVYFQEIMCYCCFRAWKYYNKGGIPGILLHKNAHTDYARTKSCRQKSVSVQWRQSTAETRFRNTATPTRRYSQHSLGHNHREFQFNTTHNNANNNNNHNSMNHKIISPRIPKKTNVDPNVELSPAPVVAGSNTNIRLIQNSSTKPQSSVIINNNSVQISDSNPGKPMTSTVVHSNSGLREMINFLDVPHSIDAAQNDLTSTSSNNNRIIEAAAADIRQRIDVTDKSIGDFVGMVEDMLADQQLTAGHEDNHLSSGNGSAVERVT